MIKQLIRYGITSLGGLIFNLLLLSALVEVASVNEIPAAVFSAGITLLLTFTSVQGWVFTRHQAQSGRIIMKRASAYFLIMIISKLVNIIIYSLLLQLDIWYIVAWLIGSGTVFGGTFVTNRYIWNKTGA